MDHEYVNHIKIINPTSVTLNISLKNKKQIQNFRNYFSKYEEYSDYLKDIDEQLKPRYVYTVKCSECPRVWQIERTTRLKQSQLDAGGICIYCSDDYK